QRPDFEAIGKNTKYNKMTRTARLHVVQKEGESWLKSYPGFIKASEGQGVLYELGLAYYMEAEEIKNEIKAPKKVDPKKPETKKPLSRVDEAQFYLTGAYLAYGDPYRAVIIAESVGRHRPPTKRSPEAAAIAIATYSGMQAKQPDNASIRQRMHDMAEYVLLPE